MIRRHRIHSDEFSVQEVNGMYVTKVYFTLDELNDFIKEKLSKEDRVRFENSAFIPIKIGLNDSDLTIEATFVTAH